MDSELTLYPFSLFSPVPDVELLVSDMKEKLLMRSKHGAYSMRFLGDAIEKEFDLWAQAYIDYG